jgi:four helix bundle protein
MYIKTYKELIVWQKSILLVKEIFLITDKFPKTETYGIVAQMRRAAVSIPSNIAEGYGRKSIKDYTRFYAIAYGSSLELETQLIIAKELHFLTETNFINAEQLLEEVLKMLNTMTTKMKQLNAKG